MPGFPVSTISSTFLAGTIGDAAGQQSRHIAVPGRLVVYALLFIVFVIVLLATPVIWQAGAEAFSGAAEKAAPATFFLGLGVLFTGLVASVELLDIVGASLVGLVVLGVIIDNYLTAVRRAASARASVLTGSGRGAGTAASRIATSPPRLWPGAVSRDRP
jgi:hypothetical protein